MFPTHRQHRLFLPGILLGIILFCFSALAASAQQFRKAPDLAIEITPPTNGCSLGRKCPVSVTLRNLGQRPFVGVINMLQTVRPKRAGIEGGAQAGWICRTGGAIAGCARSTGRIRPGTSSNFSLNLLIPRNTVRKRASFCAEIDWRAPGAMTGRNRMMQTILARRGYRMDPPDGIIGPQTRAAIGQFQLQNRLPITGVPNQRTMNALVGRWGVGDGNAKNDRACIKIPLIRTGTPAPEVFAPPSPPSPQVQQPQPTLQKPVKLKTTPSLACGRRKFEKNGACVCKPEYREMPDKSCVQIRDSAPRPTIVAPPQCTGGKFRSVRGDCVCPAGQSDVAGTCRVETKTAPPTQNVPAPPLAPEPEQVEPPKTQETPIEKPRAKAKSCPGSQIVGKEGTCGCYLNLKNKDGKCLVKVRKDCFPGQIINIRGKCECPKGETVRNGQCDKL
jgi:hypothetical protein